MTTFNGIQVVPSTNISFIWENFYGVVDDVGGAQFSPVQWPLFGSYIFRGFDTTLSQTVHWQANFQDSTGTQYTGAGPLTNIVLIRKGKR